LFGYSAVVIGWTLKFGDRNNNEFLIINLATNEKDKMTLYNIKTGQKQFFSFPNDIFNEPQILNRIPLTKLTDKEFVIKYDTEKGTKIKKYSR
jgi:hypothetical protein